MAIEEQVVTIVTGKGGGLSVKLGDLVKGNAVVATAMECLGKIVVYLPWWAVTCGTAQTAEDTDQAGLRWRVGHKHCTMYVGTYYGVLRIPYLIERSLFVRAKLPRNTRQSWSSLLC
jgi:hypothetical protein